VSSTIATTCSRASCVVVDAGAGRVAEQSGVGSAYGACGGERRFDLDVYRLVRLPRVDIHSNTPPRPAEHVELARADVDEIGAVDEVRE
jgi:hypothetical protein